MGCDIHLRIEQRKRVNPYPINQHNWSNVGFDGEFNSRIYGMFARMAKVRDYYGDKYKVQFEPRGLPDDMNWSTCESFYLHVTDDEAAVDWGEHYCLKEMAEKWVEQGYSKCFDDCFKQEDGTYKSKSDYVEWLGLVSLCEGIESDGIHECRVVFAFDN